MSTNSSIEWTDATWNPTTGCSIVSPGCKNCYAMRMAARLEAMHKPQYAGTTRKVGKLALWTGKLNLVRDALALPMTWKKPRRVFVNSMSDLFHDAVPFDYIDRVFAVMALTPQHTYQVLTKRPERMAEYLGHTRGPGNVLVRVLAAAREMEKPNHWVAPEGPGWPYRNVWLGCSPVNQKTYDEYRRWMRKVTAAVKWYSLEPLLGPIELGDLSGDGIGWVVVGGESGPGARPCNVEWVRSIVGQCRAAAVACFVKQLGAVPMEYPTIPLHRQGGGVMRDSKGGDPEEWPEDLRVREMPMSVPAGGTV